MSSKIQRLITSVSNFIFHIVRVFRLISASCYNSQKPSLLLAVEGMHKRFKSKSSNTIIGWH